MWSERVGVVDGLGLRKALHALLLANNVERFAALIFISDYEHSADHKEAFGTFCVTQGDVSGHKGLANGDLAQRL